MTTSFCLKLLCRICERVSTQTAQLLLSCEERWRQGSGVGGDGGVRPGVAACLVVLLHDDLPVKHPSPLPQHVEVELRKHWRE